MEGKHNDRQRDNKTYTQEPRQGLVRADGQVYGNGMRRREKRLASVSVFFCRGRRGMYKRRFL